MSAKSSKTSALDAELAALVAEVKASQARIRHLLLAGADTSPARAALADTMRRIKQITAKIAAAELEKRGHRDVSIAAEAETTAGEIIAAIDTRLAALNPPNHPEHMESDQ